MLCLRKRSLFYIKQNFHPDNLKMEEQEDQNQAETQGESDTENEAGT